MCTRCELECKCRFDEEFVCIKCALEADPFTREQFTFFERKVRAKKNEIDTLRDLENLWLGHDVDYVVYELYQNVTKNKLYRSKMRKIILCACICKVLGDDCDVENFLSNFNISVKDYNKGIKKLTSCSETVGSELKKVL